MSAPETVAGARVGVIGLGRSGGAVTRLLLDGGARVYASDAAGPDAVAADVAELEAAGATVELEGHDVDRLLECDWIVTSPGVPPDARPLRAAAAAGVEVYGELEVASWHAEAPIVAITGTNGKTTTTALLGEIAREGGLRAVVAGNIGRAFSDAVREEPGAGWYVLEASSFQLGRIATFRPRVAVVLNLAADHLDTYPSFEAYRADKERIAENQGEGDHLCLSAEDPALAGFGASRPVRRHWFHRTAPVERGAAVVDGWITLVGEPAAGRVLPADALRIPGAHNLQNALAATLAASRMGVGREGIAAGLRSFRGVPHRLETVSEIDGVRWVNDSKATNVSSAAAALEAFDAPLLAILGGHHKGASYESLATPLSERARRVLAIGEAADRISDELGGVVEVEVAGTLDRAVERARDLARPGDVVLLAPACSSYDQFEDYEARGEAFRALVTAAPVAREAGE
ncbi:MAG: UDP-N-acetylmuramoyl-L-alanine--D-glutamate ligase [Gemmatimonadota bacterium]|nr:UDP-N-acetylmuramoyl-L-alanine--D-glutamate ligase [Gemmatimonadota bacterium]